MEGGAEITWNRRLEIQGFTRDRVVKRQAEGVQTHAAARIVLVAVFSITHNGVADVGHVDTDLILAASEQMQEK